MDERLLERRLLARAGFGPRPDEPETLRREGARAWLARELAHTEPRDPELEQRLGSFPSLRASSWDDLLGVELPPRMGAGGGGRVDPELRKEISRRSREITHEVVGARVVRAVHGRFGLREAMLDFWSNHFSVFARKGFVGALLPHYQREVLEPHALGRFEDLLLAVARSPAMLVYLDNWNSTAPRSGRRRRFRGPGRGGINENYARELLELHTLGVDAGYSQADVIEVARVFTGWSLASRSNPVFRFHDALHDTGRKRVMGEPVAGHGVEEGEGLLRRLARHPSTARHVCRKLATRFVADAPPAGLVARAQQRFLESEGDLRQVLSEILLSPELADPEQRKLKTPFRFAVSALRASGGSSDGRPATLLALGRLGELPYFARTPAGFPEQAQYWVDPGAMLERMAFAFALARGAVPGSRAGSARLSDHAGADPEPLALCLASPEFQWA